MEARSRAVAAPVDDDLSVPEARPERAARAAATRPQGRGRRVDPRAILSRDREFAYIRADLRRLVVTAGPLLLLIVALLLVIDR